ncbi:MAG TPA: hypothetical protein VE621_07360 [Bryobacteraceae bacterium]|jgi:hypothetical protein|nr:hypothetical protein [Bryobacteraceae bacterium]
MCWYSAEHSGQELLKAEVGERLCVRQMHGYSRWVVREEDAAKNKPRPVCLLDGTSVLFRPSEAEQAAHGIDPEAEAVFRMLSHPRRDIFEYRDGRQLEINTLPVGLTLDVMMVPGHERFPTPLADTEDPAEELVASGTGDQQRESLLARVRRLF